MKSVLLSSAALLILAAGPCRADETVFPAKLVSHAILPANTIIPAPSDAPDFLKTSAKFTTADRRRTEGLSTLMGKDGNRETGLEMPFDGQAEQGFSGIKTMQDGTFWSLSDNGFGSKINSADSMLMLHHLKFDWDAGKVETLETVFLSDPDKKAPFPIVMEGSDTRYLTGADFDVESIQPVADGFFIGEEFGPYMLKVTKDGKLTQVTPTEVDGKPVMSPDNAMLVLPPDPTKPLPAYNLKRSNGFEGLAISRDASRLYAMLEGALYLGDGAFEQVDGENAFRIIELDAATGSWTGRSWLYPMSAGGTNIGDFNMVDDTTGLVIERDGGEGTKDKACADPEKPETTCFAKPALHKRIYKIEMTDETVGKAVRKIGYIDLMAISDPDNKKRQGGGEGFYDMPFVTIENVDVVDDSHIIVGNDNNLPFSAGRALDKADDNEFVLLEVGEFLKAR